MASNDGRSRLLAAICEIPVGVATVLAACGGGILGLDPAFSGTWVGPVVISAPGQQSVNYTGGIVVAVAGSTATVAGLCLNGGGTVTFQGSGDSASWSGALAWSPFSTTSCASVAQVLTHLQATLNGTMLSGQGTGTLTGCGLSFAVTFTFTGTKQ